VSSRQKQALGVRCFLEKLVGDALSTLVVSEGEVLMEGRMNFNHFIPVVGSTPNRADQIVHFLKLEFTRLVPINEDVGLLHVAGQGSRWRQ